MSRPIVKMPNSKTVEFNTLEVGETFVCTNCLYIKTFSSRGNVYENNAIALSKNDSAIGSHKTFFADAKVIPVKVTMDVKYE